MANEHMEVIHHPNHDGTVVMPFVPAIKIRSGKLLWLAGTTALPVYHDHPHRREDLAKHMPNDLEAQTRASMEGIKKTLEAAGEPSEMSSTSLSSGRAHEWGTSEERARSSTLISLPTTINLPRLTSRFWNSASPSSL